VKVQRSGPGETPADESDLVRAAQNGDRDALGRLVSRHEGVVYRFLLGILTDEDRAADVTQETFVRALGSLDGFRGEASFRTWLLSIARNEAWGALRRAGRRREAPLEDSPSLVDPDPDPETKALDSTEVERVRRALATLPEKQRMTVSLRLFDGLNYREIAELTDSTEGSARVNYHHGIRRLRERLDDG